MLRTLAQTSPLRYNILQCTENVSLSIVIQKVDNLHLKFNLINTHILIKYSLRCYCCYLYYKKSIIIFINVFLILAIYNKKNIYKP